MKAVALLQVGSFGPKSMNVNVPVGFDPPCRLALSKICNPTVRDGEAVEEIVGVVRASDVPENAKTPSNGANIATAPRTRIPPHFPTKKPRIARLTVEGGYCVTSATAFFPATP
jgi:hypothetical protein